MKLPTHGNGEMRLNMAGNEFLEKKLEHTVVANSTILENEHFF